MPQWSNETCSKFAFCDVCHLPPQHRYRHRQKALHGIVDRVEAPIDGLIVTRAFSSGCVTLYCHGRESLPHHRVNPATDSCLYATDGGRGALVSYLFPRTGGQYQHTSAVITSRR